MGELKTLPVGVRFYKEKAEAIMKANGLKTYQALVYWLLDNVATSGGKNVATKLPVKKSVATKKPIEATVSVGEKKMSLSDFLKSGI